MAKNLEFKISAGVERAEQEVRKLQATGQQVASILENDFAQLGARSTLAIEAQREAYVNAYERIKRSGVATWQEVQTAHAAMTAKVEALDLEAKFGPGAKAAKSVRENFDDIGTSVDKLTPRVAGLVATLAAFYVGSKLWEGFKSGVEAVDQFEQSVTKTAALITTLQTGGDISSNYQRAKEYAKGLNDQLMQIDSRTVLNLANLQDITEEMVKQGVVLDYTNKSQVDGFTNIANAVAVYSANGKKEAQLRQEISALLRGEVNQNSQLASMLQRTVDGPLQKYVDQWKQSGTFITEIGSRLKGFGPAADDLATSWGAVKSSFETSMNLVLRAGFTGIVKDIARELDKVNGYLKTHREEIGGEIRKGWETTKKVLSEVATIAKVIDNNFEPFAALIIGGAIIGGLARIVTVFTTLRDLVISTRLAMIGMGMATAGAGAAGAATVAGGATGVFAGSAAGAAAGAGLAYTGAGLLGLGLGYAAQPLVRWADRKLYESFGINLTGEEMANQNAASNRVADQRWEFFQAENANSPRNRAAASAGSAIPQLKLGDSQEQIKEKINLQEKELAAFKANQDAMSALAKEQASVRLSVLKTNYDLGLASTTAYYEAEKEEALRAAQERFDNAAEYLKKEESLLAYVASKKGTSSPEYAEELARNRKALGEMQSAQLAYAQVYVDTEGKMKEALKKRNDEYDTMKASLLEAAGEYVEYERRKQEMDDKSINMLRLRKEAEEGVKGAVEALAAVEAKRAADLVAAQNRENEAARGYRTEIAKLKDKLDELNGKNKEIISAEASLRDGINSETQLREKLNFAIAQGNKAAASALSQEITLQDQLNTRLKTELDLKYRKAELTGQIVGWSNGKPVYADSYQNEQNATRYVSNSELVGTGSGATTVRTINSPFVDISSPINGWTGPSFDVGTPYVPRDMIAKIHKGERILTAAENASGSYGKTSISFGDLYFTLPNVTDKSSAKDLAREAVPEIVRLLNKLRKAA